MWRDPCQAIDMTWKGILWSVIAASTFFLDSLEAGEGAVGTRRNALEPISISSLHMRQPTNRRDLSTSARRRRACRGFKLGLSSPMRWVRLSRIARAAGALALKDSPRGSTAPAAPGKR
jgi:hypothetical protein